MASKEAAGSEGGLARSGRKNCIAIRRPNAATTVVFHIFLNIRGTAYSPVSEAVSRCTLGHTGSLMSSLGRSPVIHLNQDVPNSDRSANIFKLLGVIFSNVGIC
jgi:hypothetical protein